MIVSDGYAAASKKQTPKIDMNTKVIDAYSVAVDIKTNLPDGTLLMVYMRFADDTVGIPSVSISSDGYSDNAFLSVRKGKVFGVIDPRQSGEDLEWFIKGDYEIVVELSASSSPENKKIAKRFGISEDDDFEIVKQVSLEGNGKGISSIEPLLAREKGRSWVTMEDTYGQKKWVWTPQQWQEKIGDSEAYSLDDLNPKIFKVFYFKTIDMSVLVDINRDEIIKYKKGRAANASAFELTPDILEREEIVMSEEERSIRDYIVNKFKSLESFDAIDKVEFDPQRKDCRMFVFITATSRDLAKQVGEKAARWTIDYFLSKGQHPQKEEFFISCRVAIKGKTASGKAGMKVLGVARYSYNDDAIEWEERE